MGTASKYIRTVQKEQAERGEYYLNISDTKRKRKFIERVKRIIRSSMEYRDYMMYLRDHVDMDSCAFFANVTSNPMGNIDNKKVKIEIHHEPFTLDDYVSVVLEKYIDTGQKVDSLDIADEVMEIHYKNEVGLIPLSKTIHQIVHNTQKIHIPIYMCYGNYKNFVHDYEPYLEKLGLLDKLEKKIKITNELTEESFDAIRKEFEYIEVDGRDNELHKIATEEDVAVA